MVTYKVPQAKKDKQRKAVLQNTSIRARESLKFPDCIGLFPECKKYNPEMKEEERHECKLCPYNGRQR